MGKCGHKVLKGVRLTPGSETLFPVTSGALGSGPQGPKAPFTDPVATVDRNLDPGQEERSNEPTGQEIPRPEGRRGSLLQTVCLSPKGIFMGLESKSPHQLIR